VTPSGEERTVREIVEALAPLERRAGSEAERQAAQFICERLQAAGCQVVIEEEGFLDGYASVIGPLAAAGLAAALAGLRERSRKLALAGALAVIAAIADDVSNGPRLFRRATRKAKTTWNVVARAGDPTAQRTLIVLAHHDAAPTGAIFDDRPHRWVGERFPGVIERTDTSAPLWWPMLAAPALVAAGAARRKRGLLLAGAAGCLLGMAVFADIGRSPVTPGANDNLSAVALLVALALRLQAQPLHGLRVLLVSCGAEEVLQGGIYGFAARHFPTLPQERTWFLNIDSVGSPRLILVEGEGPVVMEDYPDPEFRELIGRVAAGVGVPLRRGMRARSSTDAVIPSRGDYPTATISSLNHHKAITNYHLMTDTPENLHYATVLQAVTLTEAVARALAASAPSR
jgi:hypothetical protein